MSPTVAPPTSDELHDIWRTRPVRSGGDTMIAGVCSGIARRYDVDPTLVRVALVVAATFGGSGVVAYIACWFLLPSDGVENTRRRGHLGTRGVSRDLHRPGTVGLVVVAIIALAILPSPAWGSSGLVGAVLLVLGVWALHRRTPEPPPGTSVDTIGTVSLTKQTATPTDATTDATTERVMPPAWDPLGAAPFAWDLPEPPAPAAPSTARPARDTALAAVVVGLALLVAAIGVALWSVVGVAAVTPLRVAGAVLAVLAVGVIAGALRGRRTGLTGLAVLVALLVVVLGVADRSPQFPSGGVGERNWAPTSERDIAPRYSVTVGAATLDLRSVTLTADRTVRVEAGVGQIVIDVPRDMNVRTTCHTTVGKQDCASGIQGGDDGAAGPVLTIDASTIAGDIEVRRG